MVALGRLNGMCCWACDSVVTSRAWSTPTSGPPSSPSAVAAEPLVDPAALVRDADAAPRRPRGRLAARPGGRGCAPSRGALAGEPCSYGDEVEGGRLRRPAELDRRGGVRGGARAARRAPARGRAAAGNATSAGRPAMRVPRARRSAARSGAVIEESRRLTSRLVHLPDGEGVDLELVRDEPWLGFELLPGQPAGPGVGERRRCRSRPSSCWS